MSYISLQEATKYCRYSADYLKLRARQGRLRAIKIGRNWVTTRLWVEEYVGGTTRQPRRLTWRTVLLTLVAVLIIIGVFMNFDIAKEYYQWQTANIGGFFNEGLNIIPGKVIEVK